MVIKWGPLSYFIFIFPFPGDSFLSLLFSGWISDSSHSCARQEIGIIITPLLRLLPSPPIISFQFAIFFLLSNCITSSLCLLHARSTSSAAFLLFIAITWARVHHCQQPSLPCEQPSPSVQFFSVIVAVHLCLCCKWHCRCCHCLDAIYATSSSSSNAMKTSQVASKSFPSVLGAWIFLPRLCPSRWPWMLFFFTDGSGELQAVVRLLVTWIS